MLIVGVGLLVVGLLLGLIIGYMLKPNNIVSPPAVAQSVENVGNKEVDDSIVSPTPISLTATQTLPPPTTVATWTPTWTPSPSPTPMHFSEGPMEYGKSVIAHPLYAYRLGNGPSARALIGGIHGGYEWNTVEFVSETLKYLQENPTLVPLTVTLYLIPCANPDGYAAGTDAVVARMNGNGVDLNRNWDYQWQMTATHGTRPVKAGTEAFSEPETDALRRFIEEREIELVIFYHSAMGVVFGGAEPENSATFELAQMLAQVTGYKHQIEGIPGQITTGDAIDWLSAKKGIAGAEIEFTTHDSILGTQEYQRNLQAVQAFLEWTIPVKTQEIFVAGEGDTYTVQEGDTGLWDIANKFGIEIDSPRYKLLLSVNNFSDPNPIIKVGDVLTIPLESENE